MSKLICKKCGAEVTQEALDYANDNEFFHAETGHPDDCGCFKYNEDLDMDACHCEFVRPSELKNVPKINLNVRKR